MIDMVQTYRHNIIKISISICLVDNCVSNVASGIWLSSVYAANCNANNTLGVSLYQPQSCDLCERNQLTALSTATSLKLGSNEVGDGTMLFAFGIFPAAAMTPTLPAFSKKSLVYPPASGGVSDESSTQKKYRKKIRFLYLFMYCEGKLSFIGSSSREFFFSWNNISGYFSYSKSGFNFLGFSICLWVKYCTVFYYSKGNLYWLVEIFIWKKILFCGIGYKFFI